MNKLPVSKKHIIIASLSLAGLVSLTIFNIEKISFFDGVNVINLFGIVQMSTEKSSDNSEPMENTKPHVMSSEASQTKNVEETISMKIDVVSIDPQNNNNNFTYEPVVIENNKRYSGKLVNKYDTNIYNLYLVNDSAVNFSLSVTKDSSYKIFINKANTDKTIIETEINEIKKSFNTYLRSGDYNVKITGGKIWNTNSRGNSYSLMAKISNTRAVEAEINDTEETANVVAVNKPIKASLHESDVDYFSFKIDKAMSVLPRMTFAPLNGYELKFYELILEDEFGVEISEFDFRGDGKPSGAEKWIRLEAGNYFVKISRIKNLSKSKIDISIHEYELFVAVKD